MKAARTFKEIFLPSKREKRRAEEKKANGGNGNTTPPQVFNEFDARLNAIEGRLKKVEKVLDLAENGHGKEGDNATGASD